MNYIEKLTKQKVRAFEKLYEILSTEELDAVAESSKKFREELKLR